MLSAASDNRISTGSQSKKQPAGEDLLNLSRRLFLTVRGRIAADLFLCEKNQRGNAKVYKQGQHIDYSRYERACHYRGIKADFFRKQGH